MEEKDNILIDYDTRWKEIITSLFEDFIKFFLPKAHKLIDFQSGITFMEQELLKLFSDKNKEGKVINDKLVKVRLKSGEDRWILIHIEVQSTYESRFGERMFKYFYRIYDKYDQKITAIAIYTGDKVPKRYNKYEYEFVGTKLSYEYNTYKVSEVTETTLLKSKNPFSLVVLASKYSLKSKDDFDKRYSFKLKLIRLCKERKYSEKQIVNLFRFIDLILVLPEKLELQFEKEVIKKYIKSVDMQPTKSQIRFANKIHLALYGETIEEKIKREERDKAAFEKSLIIQKVMRKSDMSDSEISEIFNVSIDIIKDIRKGMEKN